MQIIGWLAVCALAVVLLWNGVFMLISPRAWFRLPSYLRLNGGLTEKKYGSGWGAVQTRITGGIFVGGILWVVYDMLLVHR
jgi:hypothetical protein